MIKIAIIHFNVIELYPPAINFLDILSNKIDSDDRVICITNKSSRIKIKYENSKIKILRIITLNKNNFRLLRLTKYIYFNLFTILKLLIFRPSKILYYESHSSYPAYIYKKYLNKRVDVLVHYHEYMTEEEYKNGMFMVNYYHQCEKKLYNEYLWISFTNKHFVYKFKKANPFILSNNLYYLNNYPRRTWSFCSTNKKRIIIKPIKFVFIGALDLDTSYLKNFCFWVRDYNIEATLDITKKSPKLK